MEKINNILAVTLNVSRQEVEKNLTMDDVDLWDSLSHMNLIVAIEDAFEIELSGDDIAEMTSFDSIRTIMEKYK